jgi:hypothetical protein
VSRIVQIAALAALVASASPAVGSDGWAQLRRGMSRNETAAAIGDPLFKNRGRGFELWLYDGGAEVVCYRDTLVAWTPPPVPFRDVAKAQAPKTAVMPTPPAGPRSVTREELRRVYDKFPAFRTEIRL